MGRFHVSRKVSKTICYASLLTSIVFVVFMLFLNGEVFYTAHERSEFLYGTPFFHTLMSKPFGLMQYVGAWLTQFFYYPALGSAILALIWVLIFYVGKKAFSLTESSVALMLLPVACLLTSVVDLGYWIYIFTIKGYWFSQSVSYLVMLLLLWTARSTPRRWHIVWYVLGLCLYPVLGWFALLFVLSLAVIEKPSWREVVAVIVLIIAAPVWRTLLYSNIKPDDLVMAGMPHFETPNDVGKSLSIPFFVLGALTLLISAFGRYAKKWFVPALSAVVGMVFVTSLRFHDRNYINEMRMVRYSQEENWNEVLNIAADAEESTTTMTMLRNIALMNQGGLLDRSFKMGNIDAGIYNPDTLHVGFLNTAAPLAYYNYGLITEAIRLNYEGSIQTGFSPFYLKMLSRCCMATGEVKLLERYTKLLHNHPFYSDWEPAPPTKYIKELQNSYSDEITGVENSDRFIVTSICLWDKVNSKVASEQALFYTMIRCDANAFWDVFRKYLKLHTNDDFPVHAQEAYILYLDRAPEEKRMMLPVEEDVYNRYKAFTAQLESKMKPGTKLGTVAMDMQKEWSDTYWYYYFFKKRTY